MRIVSLLILASAAMLLNGCATMTSGTTQEMSFQSSPDTVIVTLVRSLPDGDAFAQQAAKKAGTTLPMRQESRILGKTPFTLQLDRIEDPQSVVFSKEGYTPVTMKLGTQVNGYFWGNILFGGFFGSTTDSASGAMHEYEPSQFLVTLNPDGSTPIDHRVGQADRDKALAFIVRRHSAVLANLNQGTGEDWSSLMTLLHIAPTQEADARQKLKALASVYPDAGTFATHVTDLYLK